MQIRRAASIVLAAAVLVVAAGCSRENQDWRSAQAADTAEGYDDFVAKHPQSEFAEQAKSRVKQLAEERDWERATVADTAEAYQQFLAQHPDGKWAQEARVRIENFNVIDGGAPKPAEGAPATAAAAPAAAGETPAAGKPAAAMPVPQPAAAAKPTAGAKPAPEPRPEPAAAPKPAPAAKPAAAVKPAPAKPAPAPKPTAAHKAAAAAKPAVANGGSHHIQLGAFSSSSKADAEWKRVSAAYGELKGLSSRVVAAQTSAGKLYRLQAAVPSEERGRAICRALSAHKQACVYVKVN